MESLRILQVMVALGIRSWDNIDSTKVMRLRTQVDFNVVEGRSPWTKAVSIFTQSRLNTIFALLHDPGGCCVIKCGTMQAVHDVHASFHRCLVGLLE